MYDVSLSVKMALSVQLELHFFNNVFLVNYLHNNVLFTLQSTNQSVNQPINQFTLLSKESLTADALAIPIKVLRET